MKLSVVICTYNRSELLSHCLKALTEQTTDASNFEIIVVNNNSTDDTQEVVETFMEQHTNIRLVFESEQGLSSARNRGYKEAKHDWVAYIDDDAKAKSDLVERTFWILNNTDYKCFGGLYIPWFHYGEPYWFKERYGSNRMSYKSITTLKNGEYACGGVMFFDKQLLIDNNGFSTKLGMIGGKVAYGEETELQLRLRNDGIKIAYDPKLVIEHVVAPYKLKLDWYFVSRFALGRDQIEMGIFKTGGFSLFLTALVLFFMIILHLLWYTPKLILRTYYVQNWMIDVFRKPAKRIGVLYTALIAKSEKAQERNK